MLSDTATALLDTLAGVDWAVLPVADRFTALEDIETVIRTLRAASHAGCASIASEDAAVLGDKPVMAIANRLRISPTETRRRLRHAELVTPQRSLTGTPVPPVLEATATAWDAGTLDPEHLDVIDKLVRSDLPRDTPFDVVQECEALLAGEAAGMRPDELRQVAARLAATINPDGKYTDADRARNRALTLGPQQSDGMTKLTGLLTPELRAALEAILGKLAAPGACNPADETPCVTGEPDDDTVRRDTRTPAQRRHDAVLAAARVVLCSGELGSHHGLPVTVVVTASLDQLHRGTGMAVTGSGSLLPIRDLIRLGAHAYHYLAVFDTHTQCPLYLGRARRTATAAQRLMLSAQHRGCTFPRCDVPPYLCEADHVDEWANGGPTDIDSITLACRTHHELHTSGGWRLRQTGTGRTEWIPPPGQQHRGGTNAYFHPERLFEKPDDKP